MNVAFNRALTQKAIQRVFVIWFYCSVWCGCPSLQAFAHINFAGLEKSVSLFTKELLRFRKGICNVVMMCDLARFDKTTWASLLTHCVRYKLFGLTLTLLKKTNTSGWVPLSWYHVLAIVHYRTTSVSEGAHACLFVASLLLQGHAQLYRM